MNLFLIGLVAAVALVVSVKEHYKLHKTLAQRKTSAQLLPRAVTVLVMTAQLSELVKAVEHADIVHISAAMMLLVIIVAGKSGTEGELH